MTKPKTDTRRPTTSFPLLNLCRAGAGVDAINGLKGQ